MINMTLGILISNKRKELGLTQEKLATMLNVSPKTISKWETNRGFPEVTMLPLLASALSMTTDELFGYIKKEEVPTKKMAYIIY